MEAEEGGSMLTVNLICIEYVLNMYQVNISYVVYLQYVFIYIMYLMNSYI